MSLQPNRTELIAKVLFFGLIVYFPVFMHLENMSIRMWDEARLAINAYEMYKNGNYIVTHYNGSPDMWNTKPPLMIWLQVIGLHLFGTGELAIRMPSALGALFTCIGILLFCARFLKSYWLGMIAVLVLVTSDGYIDVHVARTGDYDALLICFTTLYSLCFFVFLETQKTNFLYYTAFFLIAAALTKGIAGMLFLPALFVYALFKKQLLPLIKNPHLYGTIFLFVFFVIGYYLLRDHYNPGYLQAVRENELGGRYLQTLENHKQPYWFYFFNIIGFHFTPWYLLVPVGILLGFVHQQRVIRNLALYLSLLVLFFFFTISSAQTRIMWYDAPLFPFLSMTAALFIWYWFDLIQNSQVFRYQLQKNVLPYALVFLTFMVPYSTILSKVYKPDLFDSWIPQFYYIRPLQKALQGREDVNNRFLCADERHTTAMFYVNALRDKGVNIDFANYQSLQPGYVVMTYQPIIQREIERRYETTLVKQDNSLKVYRILIAHDCSN